MALLATNAINVQRTATVIQPLSASANGTYNPPSGVDGYAPVVVNVPTGSAIELSSIAITTAPTKTAYFDGDSFDPTGMVVTATYSNGATRAINSFSSGFTFTPNPLAYTGSAVSVTVSMTEYGVTKTATQVVTVEAVGVNWATDSWDVIRSMSKNGLTARIYGSQVGATRTITLTDNTTMTIRLSNADDTMYARSDGSGTTGLCVEFVDCLPDRYYMNANYNNSGGWNACQMRTVKMPQLFNLLPSDLAAVIETVNVKAANGGSGSVSVVTSQDKLFLLAEKEVFGMRTYSVAAEADALTQWAWYATHNTNADRVKKRGGSASYWWLRSPLTGGSAGFCGVYNSGSAGYTGTGDSSGVSPGFCI